MEELYLLIAILVLAIFTLFLGLVIVLVYRLLQKPLAAATKSPEGEKSPDMLSESSNQTNNDEELEPDYNPKGFKVSQMTLAQNGRDVSSQPYQQDYKDILRQMKQKQELYNSPQLRSPDNSVKGAKLSDNELGSLKAKKQLERSQEASRVIGVSAKTKLSQKLHIFSAGPLQQQEPASPLAVSMRIFSIHELFKHIDVLDQIIENREKEDFDIFEHMDSHLKALIDITFSAELQPDRPKKKGVVNEKYFLRLSKQLKEANDRLNNNENLAETLYHQQTKPCFPKDLIKTLRMYCQKKLLNNDRYLRILEKYQGLKKDLISSLQKKKDISQILMQQLGFDDRNDRRAQQMGQKFITTDEDVSKVTEIIGLDTSYRVFCEMNKIPQGFQAPDSPASPNIKQQLASPSQHSGASSRLGSSGEHMVFDLRCLSSKEAQIMVLKQIQAQIELHLKKRREFFRTKTISRMESDDQIQHDDVHVVKSSGKKHQIQSDCTYTCMIPPILSILCGGLGHHPACDIDHLDDLKKQSMGKGMKERNDPTMKQTILKLLTQELRLRENTHFHYEQQEGIIFVKLEELIKTKEDFRRGDEPPAQ